MVLNGMVQHVFQNVPDNVKSYAKVVVVSLAESSWTLVTPRTVDHMLLCPWGFPGRRTRMVCQFLLWGIFPTQGPSLHLLHAGGFFTTEPWGSPVYNYTSALSLLFVLVQPPSCVWLFKTPWTAAGQTSLSFTVSQSLLKFMSVDLMMLSNHLIFILGLKFGEELRQNYYC